jgi:hypothetical protein
LYRTGACIQKVFPLAEEMPVNPQVTTFYVFTGNRAEIFIDRVLIQLIADPLPADLIVKIFHLVRAG